MRRTFAILVLVAGATPSAQAQHAWQTEFGIQGGVTRMVTAGRGGDPLDAFSLPGFNLGPFVPAAPALYAIIPWKHKFAVEADVAASQFTSLATATFLTVGLRGNYALTGRLYAAAGGAVSYNNGAGRNETQLGVQAAVGYRQRLTGPLNGRIDLRTVLWAKAENVGPINAYSVLLGVSTATRRGGAPRAAPPERAAGAWATQLGVGGGYANVHLVDGGSLSALTLPGYGGGLGPLLASEVTLPPTVFAIIPLRGKIALEPGVDIHRFQSSGQTDFTGNLSARVNYAAHGGWYGAVGGNLHYIKSTGGDAATRTGLNMAWGYRFALQGPLGGRVEMNYTMFGRNSDFGLSPTNTFGLMCGVMMPLK